ncbi:MAG: cell division protein FtsK, partial [Pseudonocardiales bacterium]|nr:cell division protein FtsK [Pseudonocardiales bacterium]
EQHQQDPIGRLVLVVDEFAALAEELPDFVNGLIAIAQRGRSLGVHLVLATQRPGGVVSPEIRANTALRIALRVTDPAESGDVIGSDAAAAIDKTTPGRAMVRVGSILTAVQTARIGGHPPPVRPQVEIVSLDQWGVAADTTAGQLPGGPTDLHVLVDALRAGAEQGGFPQPRRPWLDPLPDVVDVGSLGAAGVSSVPGEYRVPIGLVDRPEEQVQEPDGLDLAQGTSLLLCGGPRSGRSSALRTIAARAAEQLSPAQLHIHIIDCAGGAMRAIAGFTHCGSMVARSQPDAIDRLIIRISEEVSRRHSLLAELGVGTAAEARARGLALPAIMLLVDGWEGFVAVAEDLDSGRPVDALLHLLRDATSTGLTIVIAGDRATLATRLSSAVQRRLILRLSDPDDYVMAGMAKGQVPSRMPPGRALNPADGSEMQLAGFGGDPGTAAQLKHIEQLVAAERSPTHTADFPFRIRALPTRIPLSDLQPADRLPLTQGLRRGPDMTGWVRLGVGGDDASPVVIAASGAEARFLIAGPPRSGRSTALITIASQLVRPGDPLDTGSAPSQARSWLVVAAGLRSPLHRWAEGRAVAVLTPSGQPSETDGKANQPAVMAELVAAETARVLLIDDCEQFNDTANGEQLAALIRSAPIGLSVFAAGRSDELAATYRGIGVELRRTRTGLLLQPGPGDGDLFGLRLPFSRTTAPPGRGYLIAEELLRPIRAAGGDSAVPIQIALT